MTIRLGATAALLIAASMLAACAGSGGNDIQTSAIPAAPLLDPACSQLTAQIDALRREGVAAKVENAAVKKYKMKPVDLSKAAQLNKAHEDYQLRCSSPGVRSASNLGQAPVAVGASQVAPPKAERSAASVARAADAAAARAAVKAASQ